MQFEMVFDPTRPDNDGKLFPKQDWDHTSYSTTNESLPSNSPEARGFGFIISTYVDSDHTGDTITRRSRTSFYVYLNNRPK